MVDPTGLNAASDAQAKGETEADDQMAIGERQGDQDQLALAQGQANGQQDGQNAREKARTKANIKAADKSDPEDRGSIELTKEESELLELITEVGIKQAADGKYSAEVMQNLQIKLYANQDKFAKQKQAWGAALEKANHENAVRLWRMYQSNYDFFREEYDRTVSEAIARSKTA